jgi:putative ABC transport system substrate-binding protein
MRRRELITVLGGAMAWPLQAHANRPDKPRRVGVLALFPASDPRVGRQVEMFKQRLRELGWTEPTNVAFVVKHPDDGADRFAKPAAELVASSDIIVTSGTPPVQALQKLTKTIPIVMASVGDPVGAGLVASLARPGGNVTGFSLQATELATKRLELIREAVPDLKRVAFLWNPNNPSLALQFRETEEAASKLGLELQSLRVVTLDEIKAAIGTASRAQAHAICATSDGVQTTNRSVIAKLSIEHRLPLMGEFKTVADAGALLSYGPTIDDLWRRAAEYVDRILRGENPAELPIQQPIKFELVINLETAKALGVTVPPALLARADEVIE